MLGVVVLAAVAVLGLVVLGVAALGLVVLAAVALGAVHPNRGPLGSRPLQAPPVMVGRFKN